MNIREIAQLAGVSISTVSKVLNRKDQAISEETRRKVLAVMKENHYQPYVVSRFYGSSHSFLIGAVLCKRPGIERFLETLMEAAAQQGDYTWLGYFDTSGEGFYAAGEQGAQPTSLHEIDGQIAALARNALQGQSGVSRIYTPEGSGYNRFAYAVPAVVDGTVVGAVAAGCSVKAFAGILDTLPDSGRQGAICLISDSGKVLVRPQSLAAGGLAGNVFETPGFGGENGEALRSALLAGESCALVTDAGTPAVSDPGEDLVALCAEHNVPIVPIPGCCAAVCALTASGLPTGRWCFEGFLSVNKKARRAHLDALQDEKRTMIFYEAPHKLCATLRDLAEAFGGERRISLSRELTKLHEETLRMTLAEAIAYFDQTPPRGEFVLIVEGAPDEPETAQDEQERLAAAAAEVRRRMAEGQTQKDAVKAVSAAAGIKKNALYRYVLEDSAE